jgi:flagellar export protein FliJ
MSSPNPSSGNSTKGVGLLARLAENKVQGVTQRLSALQASQQKLDTRKAQVSSLKSDYQRQLHTIDADKGLAQVQAIRRFILNLLEMEARLDLEQQSLTTQLDNAKQLLLDAQVGQKKMESLVERQDVELARKRSLTEQRAMDAAAIARFNQRDDTPRAH